MDTKSKEVSRLSIFWIRIIATVTMLIDHVGSFHPFEGWEYLRMIGRISFPLYALMLAQGFIHTRSKQKYLLRMLLLAFVTQPIYTYCFYADAWKWDELNILFTLSVGLICMWLLEIGMKTAKKRKTAWWLYCFALCAAVCCIMYAADNLGADYGWMGIALILLLYLTAEHKWAWCPIILLFAFRYQLTTGAWDEPVYQRAIFAAVALLPMLLYNGEPGPKPKSKFGSALLKYGFYLFYPLHLAVLALIFR